MPIEIVLLAVPSLFTFGLGIFILTYGLFTVARRIYESAKVQG